MAFDSFSFSNSAAEHRQRGISKFGEMATKMCFNVKSAAFH